MNRLPMKPRGTSGAWACYDCAAPLPNTLTSAGLPARPRVRCLPCGNAYEEMRRALWMPAQRLLHVAIRRGLMLPARDYYCVDCGEFAHAYDHRDYSKPLDVDPVCRRCNHKRGPAVDLLRAQKAAPAEATAP